jgi:enoyl-CoA hydratase/carnithine racemase
MSHDVTLEPLGDCVYELRIDRPERMNALGVATVEALQHAVREATGQHARVLLLRGSGRAFCAGADLKERRAMNLAGSVAHNAGINAVNDAIAAAPFVTIAALNGLALGGGLEMALACDLRLAAAGVSLGLTESRVGIFPGAGGTQRLPRLIGTSRALQMMLTGEPVTSEQALAMGLVNEVLPADELLPRAQALARKLAGHSAPAMAALKRLVQQGMELPLDEALHVERAALRDFLGSRDYAEGLAAFAERRPPHFTDTVQ